MRAGVLLSAVVLVGPVGTSAKAAAPLIDQSFAVTSGGYDYNTSYAGDLPIGQSFTPSLTGLNFVDVLLQDAGSDTGPGASFQVKIHSASITGSVLGTSNVTAVPDNLNLGLGSNEGYTRFLFPSTVSLTPGQLDVLEVVQLQPITSGNFNFALTGNNNTTGYTLGDAIINGQTQANFDFAFREGVVPEPTSLLLAGVGFALLAPRRRATTV